MTIVEAAFALPILFTFIFGLIDLGMWTFNANQATNAARDGARLGIIDFETADVTTSAMHAAIIEAVESRLEESKVESVTVRCVTDAGANTPCSTADVDVDNIRVEVEWAWDLVTPVAAILGYDRGEATGTATMRLVGRPLPSTAGGSTTTTTPSTTTTTPSTTTTTAAPDSSTSSTSTTTTTAPPSCAVTLLKIEQPSEGVVRKKQGQSFTGQLKKALPVSFVTNGAAGCVNLRVQVESPSGQTVQVACGCDYEPPQRPKYRWSYEGSDNIWFNAGTGYMRIFNGATELAEAPFIVQ